MSAQVCAESGTGRTDGRYVLGSFTFHMHGSVINSDRQVNNRLIMPHPSKIKTAQRVKKNVNIIRTII
jgi:hypothetical protein